MTVCLAMYCYARAIIPQAKNRRRIFIRPIPSKKVSSYDNIAEQRFNFLL